MDELFSQQDFDQEALKEEAKAKPSRMIEIL